MILSPEARDPTYTLRGLQIAYPEETVAEPPSPSSSSSSFSGRVYPTPAPFGARVGEAAQSCFFKRFSLCWKKYEALSFWKKFRIAWKESWALEPASLAGQVEKVRMEKLYEAFDLEMAIGENGVKKSQGRENTISNYTKESLITKIREDLKKQKRLSLSPNIEKLAEEVLGVRDLLQRMKDGKDFTTVEEIQKKISQIAETSTVYKQLIDTDNPAVLFIQFLGHLTRLAEVDSIYSKYIEEKLSIPNQQGHCTHADLADSLERDLRSPPTGIEKKKGFMWGVRNPSKGLHAASSRVFGKSWDSFEGNVSTAGHTYEKDGKTAQFLKTPGITGQGLYEFVLLPLYKKLGMSELRFNYQDMNKGKEAERIREVDRIAKNSRGLLDHVVIGHDTKISRNQKLLSDYVIGMPKKDFITRFGQFVQEGARNFSDKDNGYKIPEALLPDAELEAIFQEKGPANKLYSLLLSKSALDKRAQAEAMMYGCDAMIETAILHKKFDKMENQNTDDSVHPGFRKGNVYITGSCKEYMDRAPGRNEFRNVIWEASNQKLVEKFSLARLHEKKAAVMARAIGSANRVPSSNKARPYISNLRTIAENVFQVNEVMANHFKQANPLP